MTQSEEELLRKEIEQLKQKISDMEREQKLKSKAMAVIELLSDKSTEANAYLIKETDQGYIVKELILPEKARRQF